MESVDSIENYLGSKRNFRIYSENKMLRRAVERELETGLFMDMTRLTMRLFGGQL